MKKVISNHKAIQKILVAIILMLSFNFIIPNYSQADVGGVLLKPITDLFTTIGDAVCSGLQMFLIDGQFWSGDGILNAFLISSNNYNSSTEKFSDEYSEINYKGDTGIPEYKFKGADIDEEGFDLFNIRESIAIPVAKYTPDAIFSGQIPALDINFISPKDWKNDDMNDRSVAVQLHETVATWYVALRNLAIVGLMVVLVYVGIRIVISSTASDKAKYKQLLLDWLVAMCLLFCLHYIMSFTITITQEITNAINGSEESANTIPVVVYDGNSDTNVKVKFNTNLMGIARFQTRIDDGGTKLLYTIIYLALVIYTCMFTFTYLKRVITMAFLTLIAPLVALTYPIDKINDGKAQAFNMWLKEYIFNALLQPFHLLVYTIFVTSAMGLAATNPIYAIVALAFITPAEKILRKFFGFEKASTAGSLGTFANMAGGAAAYRMINNAVNRYGKSNKGGNGKNNNIRTSNNRQLEDPNAPGGVDGYNRRFDDDGSDNDKEGGQGQQEQTPLNTDPEALSRDQTALDDLKNDIMDDEDREYLNAEQEQIDLRRDQAALNDLRKDTTDDEDRRYLDDEQARINARRTGNANDVKPDTSSRTLEQSSTEPSQTTTESPQTTDEESLPTTRHSTGFIGRVGAGFRGSGRAIANKASTTIGNKYWRRQVGKKAVKGITHLAARGYSTVALGAVGLAAGIAGDNLEDVLTYGIGGATVGATVGGNILSNTVDRIGSGVANNTLVQGFADGFTGTTQMERQVEAHERELQADPSFMQQVNEDYADGKLSVKELKEATARAAKFAVSGVDPSKIGKTMKVEDSILDELSATDMKEEEKRKMAREQATSAAKLADKIKNPEALVGKKGEELQRRLAAQIQDKYKDLSPKEAAKNAEDMMKRVRKIKGI